MPQNPPSDGQDPNEQPTKPLPQAQPEDAGAGAAPGGADAPTVPFQPVTAETAPVAPHVPIADAGGPAAGAPLATGASGVPPTGRRSPLFWIILGVIAIILLAVGLAFALPYLNGPTPVPTETPTPSETVTVPPIETPTEEPSSEPTPTEEPAPTQEPEPDPAPTEITPTPVPDDSPAPPAPPITAP